MVSLELRERGWSISHSRDRWHLLDMYWRTVYLEVDQDRIVFTSDIQRYKMPDGMLLADPGLVDNVERGLWTVVDQDPEPWEGRHPPLRPARS